MLHPQRPKFIQVLNIIKGTIKIHSLPYKLHIIISFLHLIFLYGQINPIIKTPCILVA